VGLSDREKHLPGRLSGGERQRVAVVRSLINQPRLILADEPTGALDRVSAAEVGRLLLELNREHGITLVVATHSEELAARMDRIISMENGTLV
jgi:predicted ABC-type transport system involved in lysophospholipase L1 biosynthesis ATPase subunit